jgi:hypothetical protein
MSITRTILTGTALATVALAIAAAPGQASGSSAQKPDSAGRTSLRSASAAPGDAVARKSGTAFAKGVSTELKASAASVSTRVTSYVKSKGTRYTFGTYADPATGKVVLETDAPASVTTSLVGTLGKQTTVRHLKTEDNWSRRDDTSAFWGGSGITLSGTAPSARCSAGYTVQNSSGTRYMITAGHCFYDGQTVVTELGGKFMGYVWGNGLPTQDMELVYGGSYAPYIYLGGVNSTTGAHIASAADPVVGYNDYCHSGRTTGENCGHTVNSVSATVCTSSGCKSPVIAFTGGNLPQGGDSGAPFYVGSSGGAPDKHIRGHIIAGNGVTEYAEKWSRVAARFGVTIAS